MYDPSEEDEVIEIADIEQRLLDDMDEYGPEAPEFNTCLGYWERIERVKAETRRPRISPDTVAIVLGNLLVPVIIIAYEQKHVMVSKAKDYIMKPK